MGSSSSKIDGCSECSESQDNDGRQDFLLNKIIKAKEKNHTKILCSSENSFTPEEELDNPVNQETGSLNSQPDRVVTINPSAFCKGPSQISKISYSKEKGFPYKEKSVYLLRTILDTTSLEQFENKPVIEMIVCKKGVTDHWFVRIKTRILSGHLDYLDFHYNNIGTVQIKKPRQVPQMTEKIYYPTKYTDLRAVVKKCFDIVEFRSYSIFSYSCQHFVTDIMETFTERKISPFFGKLKIPIWVNNSRPLPFSFKGSCLEEEFWEICNRQGFPAGLETITNYNNEIEDIIKHLSEILISPRKELLEFRDKVLTQAPDKTFVQELQEREKTQKSVDPDEIKKQFLKAVSLANLISGMYPPFELPNDTQVEGLDPLEALAREEDIIISLINNGSYEQYNLNFERR